jgi:hypothetical protein
MPRSWSVSATGWTRRRNGHLDLLHLAENFDFFRGTSLNTPRARKSRLSRKGDQSSSLLHFGSVNTEANIRASAELRQAVANTRLQRIVVFLTVIALGISIVTLLVTN